MTSAKQVQEILNNGQSVANALSIESRHIEAMRIVGLVQMANVMRTNLTYPPPSQPTALDEAAMEVLNNDTVSSAPK